MEMKCCLSEYADQTENFFDKIDIQQSIIYDCFRIGGILSKDDNSFKCSF